MDDGEGPSTAGGVDRSRLDEMADELGSELIVDLIDILFEEAPKHLATMEQAAREGDADSLRRAAHTVKSSVAQLGAEGLAQMARDLEQRGDAGDLDGVEGEVERANAEWTTVREDLAALREEFAGKGQ